MKKHLIYNLNQYSNELMSLRFEFQPMKEIDIQEIGETFLDAYKDTIDYEGESLDDAVGEVKNVLNGGYGKLIDEVSVYVRIEGKIVSAIFVTMYEDKPFIPYIITMKKYGGRGIAKTLLENALNKLKSMGFSEIHLYITTGNNFAEKLYEKFGFISSE